MTTGFINGWVKGLWRRFRQSTFFPPFLTLSEEEIVLLLSIFKWFLLASITGAIVGLSTALFLKLLEWSSRSAAETSKYYYLSLPIAFFLSAAIVRYLAPEAEGHGTEKVIEAVHQRFGKIPLMVVPVKLVATLVTLAAGGSVGKEGPCAQIGGGLASAFSDILRFDDHDRKKLVICGISAGFAAVFGTPIAGAIFGIEVLSVGSILYDVLLPSFIAGTIGYQVCASFGVHYFHHPIRFVPVFNEPFFLEVVLAGLFFGICAVIMIEFLIIGQKVAKRIRIRQSLKPLVGGLVLVALTLAFSPQYLGLGLDTIGGCLEGAGIVWYAFIVKSLFTSITLNFGGSGGIVTPIFFVGASSGVLFAQIMGLNTATFAAIGLVAVVAGCANTPIAASIMAVELFGPRIAPYAAVACVISFLMTGHRSVYPSQILAIKKSASIQVEVGKVMEELHPRVQPRRRTLTGAIVRLVKHMRAKAADANQAQGHGADDSDGPTD